MSLLNEKQIFQNLSELNGWIYEDSQIQKEFLFKDFIDAISFINKVAIESEKIDHHPDIFLHSWNKVKISISTHSEGGVTEKDFNLAKRISNRTN